MNNEGINGTIETMFRNINSREIKQNVVDFMKKTLATQGGAVTRRQAALANESPDDRFMRILVDDRNAGPEQVKEVVFDDRVQIKTWSTFPQLVNK